MRAKNLWVSYGLRIGCYVSAIHSLTAIGTVSCAASE